MDILDEIYNALIADNYIYEYCYGRIKYYQYPETGDVNAPYIVIEPLDSPLPTALADNEWLRLDYLVQIEVWSKNRKLTDSIAGRVREIMWDRFGFRQQSGPKEYESGIFRDARRYSGTLYRSDFGNL